MPRDARYTHRAEIVPLSVEREELKEKFVKSIVRWRPFALFALALLGLALRLYGLNWDQGNSVHPDERQILFHVTALSWPGSLAQFLVPANSPLNPHFFAYGSFPLYLLAIIGNILYHFFPDNRRLWTDQVLV